MDFYNMIKNLDDEQLKELISFKIDEARYQAKDIPKRFIGIDCDINPCITLDGEQELDSQALWQGFIPEDVKIIYSFVPNEEGYTVNNGCYYYIDDNKYLYEFSKYIKEKDIKDDIDFLTYVYKFIDQYFNSFIEKDLNRNKMHQPLVDAFGKYITPNIGHHFKDFKSLNNAECSEYSAMAQNILSIFGYTTIYFGGAVNSIYGRGGHAFNLSLINEKPCIIDFTIPVETYSFDGKIDYTPFLGNIKDFSTESLKKHLLEYIPYEFPDYYCINVNNKIIMITNGHKRGYIVGNIEYYNEKKKVK